MKKRILGILAGIMIMMGALVPSAAFAADGSCKKGVNFFGLDPWYATLDCDSSGNVAKSNFESGRLTGTILAIVGTVVKDLLFFAGFAAVGLVMYGGFLMITSAGNPSGVEKGKKTISGALIGLVISIFAYTIVWFVMSRVAGTSAGDGVGVIPSVARALEAI